MGLSVVVVCFLDLISSVLDLTMAAWTCCRSMISLFVTRIISMASPSLELAGVSETATRGGRVRTGRATSAETREGVKTNLFWDVEVSFGVSVYVDGKSYVDPLLDFFMAFFAALHRLLLLLNLSPLSSRGAPLWSPRRQYAALVHAFFSPCGLELATKREGLGGGS